MALTKLSIDDLLSLLPTGSLDRAIINNMRYMNVLNTPAALVNNKEKPGYTFFTRPQLNMQPGNIRAMRELSTLLNDNPTSIQTYIRAMLDPRLVNGVDFGGSGSIPPVPCPLIDNMFPFITPLSNNLLSISGFPDMSVPTWDSSPGLYNEVYSLVDGRVLNFGTYDVTVNLRNTRGHLNLLLIYIWSLMASSGFEKLVPYWDMITRNEVDYFSRIYRFTMDQSNRFIEAFCCTGVAVPSGVPVGSIFDIPGDRPYIDSVNQISIRFKCNGFIAFDPIVLKDFNTVVQIFNPSMRDDYREDYLVKIPPSLRDAMNNSVRQYPRINTETRELEWWVFAEEFNRVTELYLAASADMSNYENETGD